MNADAKPKRNPVRIGFALYSVIAGLMLGIMALALFLLATALRAPDSSPAAAPAYLLDSDFDGIITINPAIPLPDIALTNQFGEASAISDLRGGHTLLAFGFLHCPDICPMTLNDMLRLRDMLGAAAERARFVFVSVDGSRDTPEAMRHYLEFRQMDGLLGLTGAEDRVRKMGAALGLAFAISDEAVPGGYTVNHSAGFFLLDEQARWIRRYQFGVPARDIAADMLPLLRD